MLSIALNEGVHLNFCSVLLIQQISQNFPLFLDLLFASSCQIMKDILSAFMGIVANESIIITVIIKIENVIVTHVSLYTEAFQNSLLLNNPIPLKHNQNGKPPYRCRLG